MHNGFTLQSRRPGFLFYRLGFRLFGLILDYGYKPEISEVQSGKNDLFGKGFF